MQPAATLPQAIRVIIGEVPSLTADIMRAALVEAGMQVAETATAAEALNQATRTPGDARATVVIVPAFPRPAAGCAAALSGNPRLKILVAVTSASRADLLELRLLGADVGRRGVVDAVRAAVAGSLTR